MWSWNLQWLLWNHDDVCWITNTHQVGGGYCLSGELQHLGLWPWSEAPDSWIQSVNPAAGEEVSCCNLSVLVVVVGTDELQWGREHKPSPAAHRLQPPCQINEITWASETVQSLLHHQELRGSDPEEENSRTPQKLKDRLITCCWSPGPRKKSSMVNRVDGIIIKQDIIPQVIKRHSHVHTAIPHFLCHG